MKYIHIRAKSTDIIISAPRVLFKTVFVLYVIFFSLFSGPAGPAREALKEGRSAGNGR